MFVNTDIYIVAANYGYADDTVTVAGKAQEYTPDGEGEKINGSFKLPARKLRVFKYENNKLNTDGEISTRDIESGLIDN